MRDSWGKALLYTSVVWVLMWLTTVMVDVLYFTVERE